MSDGPLKLSDDDFWFDPYRTEDEVIHGMAEEDRFGLILDAPTQVDLSKRTSLPLQGVQAESLRDSMIHESFDRAAFARHRSAGSYRRNSRKCRR